MHLLIGSDLCMTEVCLVHQRRFKAAFEAYKERELPNVREDVRIFYITVLSAHVLTSVRYSIRDCGYSNIR